MKIRRVIRKIDTLGATAIGLTILQIGIFYLLPQPWKQATIGFLQKLV